MLMPMLMMAILERWTDVCLVATAQELAQTEIYGVQKYQDLNVIGEGATLSTYEKCMCIQWPRAHTLQQQIAHNTAWQMLQSPVPRCPAWTIWRNTGDCSLLPHLQGMVHLLRAMGIGQKLVKVCGSDRKENLD